MTTSLPPLPVTVIAGFLGSGKTTLLNHILSAVDRTHTAVIENELGEISIDHDLVMQGDLARMGTVQGRTCCTTREAFVQQLYAMAGIRHRLDRLLIETTGVAHPGMIAHAILGDDFLGEHFRLDGIVTVVDARHILGHLEDEGHASEQIAYADVLLINKTDLVTPDELKALEERMSVMNPGARQMRVVNAQAPVAELLDIGGFDARRVEKGITGCMAVHARHRAGGLGHEHAIRTVSLAIPGDVNIDKFQAWIEAFINAHTDTLYRSKGIVALAGVSDRMIIQGVHGVFTITRGENWGAGPRETRLVFIGKNLNRQEIEAGLRQCRA